MLKSTKIQSVEVDLTINEEQKYNFIERKVAQVKKTIKKAGLPKELVY
jgi:anti-sigma28 factor (negative regulator of flagellin synthesis)